MIILSLMYLVLLCPNEERKKHILVEQSLCHLPSGPFLIRRRSLIDSG